MNTGKIVVVDDEKIVTSAFNTLLKVEGFSDTHFFNNPKDAIEFLKTNTPDLVISDFLMPEMNGLEFLSEVKKLHPEVSRILLTGYADKENAKRAVDAMIKLTEITGKPGFTARATRYSYEENFKTGNREEWHICEDNPDCEWLGETSSDEMTGHYFAYGIYFDLVADEDEKKKLEEVKKAV